MNNIEQPFPKFSFYDGPITNKIPRTSITLPDVYRGLTSKYYIRKTKLLRSATSVEGIRKLKQRLDYVTFAGTFTMREKDCLLKYSGYLCIDFDHIETERIEELKALLLNDEMFETHLLFISPSGSGLKWIIRIDLVEFPDYEINFKGVINYLRKTYANYFNGVVDYIDETGKDVSRACFLCYDPTAYINPIYTNHGR